MRIRIPRKITRFLEKNLVYIIVLLIIPSAFLFGFIGFKGIPIPVVYNLAGGDEEVTPIPTPLQESRVIIEELQSPVIPTEKVIFDFRNGSVLNPTSGDNAKYLQLNQSDYRTIHRYNVSSGKDLHVNQTIYRYMTMDKYTWYSNANGKTFNQYAPTGFEFALVFPQIYSFNESDRIWMPMQDAYALYIGGQRMPINVEYFKDIPIKDLENIFNLNDDMIVQPYGYHWQYSQEVNTTSRATRNGGWITVDDMVLRTGKSNAEDGYIMYLKPKNVDGDIQVCNNLLGESACWKILT